MKTKKLMLTIALFAMSFVAGAQALNVSSAFQDMRKNYLNKAKAEIDAACLHESTKDDPKTWCYKALIYARIGGEAANPKSKFKNLAPDWAEQAYTAALECKRLDTKNEFATQINEVFSFVGNDFYNKSRKSYEDKNYVEALQHAEKSIEMFNNAGQGQYAADAMYMAGLSAYASHDTVNLKKYFNLLIRKRTDKEFVYKTLFDYSKAENNKEQAMKIANSYVKNVKNSYNAQLLLAQAYFLNDNVDKGNESLNAALEMTKDSANLYPLVLVLAGGYLDDAGRVDEAQARYNESLTLKPSQFEANFGLGKLYFNRGVDKNNLANKIDPFSDESGMYDKLSGESKEYFRQSISYLEKAVSFIDAMTDESKKSQQRVNLINALIALETAYARVDMGTESQAAKARRESLMQQ